MKIGCLVEGPSTDEAFLRGLRRQLCPEGELLGPHYRGKYRKRRRRELRDGCRELALRGADVIVNLNDANELSWHERRDQESEWVPEELRHKVVIGAPEPNIEMWLIADPAYFQRRTGSACRPKPADPKPLVKKALADSGQDVADFVAEADLHRWQSEDRSFKAFLDECRDMARRLNCKLAGE